jgi:hypothetical protein
MWVMYWISVATKERLASLIKLSSDSRQRPSTFWLIRAIYLLVTLLMGLAFYWKIFVDKIHSFGCFLGVGILLFFLYFMFRGSLRELPNPQGLGFRFHRGLPTAVSRRSYILSTGVPSGHSSPRPF